MYTHGRMYHMYVYVSNKYGKYFPHISYHSRDVFKFHHFPPQNESYQLCDTLFI